jgi:membrane fusion protein (multidrug efflux system)
MKMPALILTVVAATLLIAPASAQDTVNLPRKEQIQKSTRKVKELQKERLAVLKALTEQLARLYQNARVEFGELLEARVQLFQAEVDAAEKQSDRLTLYKNLVDELKQYEKVAQGRVESGRGLMTTVLKIKARRLEAEIHLEEAKAEKADVKQEKIMVGSPQVKDVVITQQYVCQIHARRHIKVRALQTGLVEPIPVKEGQAVKQGEVLFKIVPVLYKAKLDIELAEVKLAELEFNNIKRLSEQKVVSVLELALYEAKLAKTRAKADLAKIELSFTEVRAPFDGLIDRLHEQQGSLVKEGDTVLTTLSDNSVMWVYFNVPEARYLEYMTSRDKEKETRIELVLANGSKFKQTGKISAIEAQFNNDSGTIPFRADFPNPDRLLRHGMAGNVLIHRTLRNATVIPQSAMFEILNKRYVYVVDKEDVAHRREIVVLNELANFFVVDRGVGGDDRIVVEGTGQVQDGEKVK